MALHIRLLTPGLASARPSATGGRVRVGDLYFATDSGLMSQVRKNGSTLEWVSMSSGAENLRLLGITAAVGGTRTIDFTMSLVQGVAGTGVNLGVIELFVTVPATATATVTATTGTLIDAAQPGGGGGVLRIVAKTNASGALVIRVVASTGTGACTAYATHAGAIGTGAEATPTVTGSYG